MPAAIKIVAGTIITDTAGGTVESLPVRYRGGDETDELGRPVDAVAVVSSEAGERVRVVTGKTATNSVGRTVSTTLVDGSADMLALFAGAVNGVLFDPSDLATLFQNSNGTTPVTADGDPVGYMADKSGNGNHAIQATAGKRPLFKTSGGLRWLQFDGTDDQLEFTAPSGTVSTLAMAGKLRSASGYNYGIAIGKQIIYANIAGSGTWGGYMGGAEIVSSYSLTTKSVVIEVTRAFNDVDLYTNGNVKETKTNGNGFNDRSGRIAGAGVQYGALDFYGGIALLRAVTAAEVLSIKASLAAKSGVAL